MARLKKEGVPQLTAQELAAFALKEGKSSFGYLAPDPNNKESMALLDKIEKKYNILRPESQFPVLLKEKMATAKRLGIPFAEAWNGTGRSYLDPKTEGKDYARNYSTHFMQAAKHPKNAQLLKLIQSAIDAEK